MIIRNIVSEYDRLLIKKWFDSQQNIKEDFQAKGTVAIRQSLFLRKYVTKYKSILEKESGYLLKERYNGIRKYKKGDKLERHLDNASPFAMTAIIYQSDSKDNPFIIYTEPPQIILLNEGDGVFFEGTKVEHERLEVQSDELIHIYVGYDILENNQVYSII